LEKKEKKEVDKMAIPGSKSKQNCGWGKLRKNRTYKRGRKIAKYSVIRDAKRIATHKPSEGKPFTGDSRAVYYIVYKKSGRIATKRVYYSMKSIPKKYKTPTYKIKRGWI
jgi:hypothetical protein